MSEVYQIPEVTPAQVARIQEKLTKLAPKVDSGDRNAEAEFRTLEAYAKVHNAVAETGVDTKGLRQVETLVEASGKTARSAASTVDRALGIAGFLGKLDGGAMMFWGGAELVFAKDKVRGLKHIAKGAGITFLGHVASSNPASQVESIAFNTLGAGGEKSVQIVDKMLHKRTVESNKSV